MKKIIALLMALVLSVLMFSGCVKTAVPTGDGQGQTGDGTTNAGDNGDSGNKDDSGNKGLKGDELKEQVAEARKLVSAGKYDLAKAFIAKLNETNPDDSAVKNLVFSITDLELYEGPIEHIFFHPIIAYPERAMDGIENDQGQNDYFVTVPEFNAVIDQMYENNYVLITMYDIFDFTFKEDGTVSAARREIYLPKGKKPYILSIDDVNYYDYMRIDGEPWKLVLDKNGEVAAYAINMQKQEEVRRDIDIIPLLDDFIKAHPDATFNNAKGLIGLTGFAGVLGYRTNSIKYDNYLEEREAVKPIIAKLKETGWQFASHSQGHRDTATATYDVIAEDTDRWDVEVLPLIEKTPIYIYPYGSVVKDSDPKHEYLRKHGFAVFCGVYNKPNLVKSKVAEGIWRQDRRAIDGVTLERDLNKTLLDGTRIVDKNFRKWYSSYMAKHGM